MSPEKELQGVIYGLLADNPRVFTLVGGGIFDRVPNDAQVPYISFGASDVVEENYRCLTISHHTMQIDCWTGYEGGKAENKELVFAVKTALDEALAVFAIHKLVSLEVNSRRTHSDPSGQVYHGIVNVTATIEEN